MINVCSKVKTIDDEFLKLIPERKQEANKGDYKKVLVIAGGRGMSGAAFFCALSAYRTGAGLVKILTHEDNRIILSMQVPEAIISTFSDEDDNLEEKLVAEIEWADIVIIGCGLGRSIISENIVKFVIKCVDKNIIIDADALNILSENRELYKYLEKNVIITPHIIEMHRLTGKDKQAVVDDMIGTALCFNNEFGAKVVLKSFNTVFVSDKDNIYISDVKVPALAKAGSGDILAGIIGGMLCHDMDADKAVACAIHIHRSAAMLAKDKLSEHGIIARDVIDNIAYVIK